MLEESEEIIPEDEAENPALVVKRLRDKLTHTEKEKQEYLEGWQRSKADFANFKKDEESRRKNDKDRATVSKAEDLFRILDGFEMGFKANEKSDPGMKSLYQLLLQIVKEWGIEQVETKVGDAFDPHKHEAMREVPVESTDKDHTVVDIFSSGYTFGDIVIRPARVSVGVFEK